MSSTFAASVVVPAHNEEALIGRCLEALAGQPGSADLEVVVVANGCQDRTAEEARHWERTLPGLKVVELAQAGKVAALNAGDAEAVAFPRIYLDADIELGPDALPHLVAALKTDAHVASPGIEFATDSSTGLVKSFYRAFEALPYVRSGLVGLGVYGLSEHGRRRFGQFPDVIADDLFVQRLFTGDERARSHGSFRVRCPRTVRDLLRVRTRVAEGNEQLSSTTYDGLDTSETGASTLRALVDIAARRPAMLGSCLVYAVVTLLARRAAGRSSEEWLRDESTRVAPAAAQVAPSAPAPVREDVAQEVEVDGVTFGRLTEHEVVTRVLGSLDRGHGGVVMTPNVDILRQLRQPETSDLADRADIVVADGMPIIWASQIQGDPLPERVTGADLVWSLCAEAAARGRSVFLLGAGPGVGEKAAAALVAANPDLRIVGHLSPSVGFEADPVEWESVVRAVEAAQPDLVMVALGFPKQERVSHALSERLPQTWLLGCGGALDMAAGDVDRAPQLFQAVGAEWIVRLAQEPRRLARRYLVDDLPYAGALLTRSVLRRTRDAA